MKRLMPPTPQKRSWTRISRWIMVILWSLPALLANAQYLDEQVLEKSFEKADFFFHPNHLNPYGLGGFGTALPGVLHEYLLDLQINPSFAVSDSIEWQYAYTDFRSSREMRSSAIYPLYADFAYSSSYIPYPIYLTESRKELEPVFSGAYFIRPFSRAKHLTFGLTYQIISKDESYYYIPQDIYTSNVGYDYNGNRAAEAQNIPITNVSGGDDRMHQEGHFINFYTGMKIARAVDAGIKAGRVVFDRDGAYGNYNSWDYGTYYSGNSSYSRENARTQNYNHWDISGGLNFHPNPNTTAGLTAGWLKGDVSQVMNQSHSSLYHYNYGSSASADTNMWFSEGYDAKTWDHDGGSVYGGLNVVTRKSDKGLFSFHYSVLRENVDMAVAGSISDTSYYRYSYESVDYESDSRFNSSLSDDRSGRGDQKAWRHYATVALQLEPEERTRLRFGLHLEKHDVQTHTSENVLADRFSDNRWSWRNRESQENSWNYESVKEKKTLNWDLRIRTFKIQIPILVTWRMSRTAELLLGINRTISRWNITDQTLAVFDYREKIRNTDRVYKERFGERYTVPTEIRTDVTTSVMAGLTVTPSDWFNIRLLVVPSYAKTYWGSRFSSYQWWIAFQLLR